jgi:hypothetical protein
MNGSWNEKRFSVVIETVTGNHSALKQVVRFIGNTNAFGIVTKSTGYSVPDDMIIELTGYTVSVEQTGLNGVVAETSIGSGSIVNQRHFSDGFGQQQVSINTPASILGLAAMQARIQESNWKGYGEQMSLNDGRATPIGVAFIPSNAIRPNVFTKTLASSCVNGTLDGMDGDNHWSSVLGSAAVMANAPEAIENHALLKILNILGGYEGMVIQPNNSTRVTYGQLAYIDPQISQKTQYIEPSAKEAAELSVAGRYAYWNAPGDMAEAMMARMIMNTVVSIANDYRLDRLAFAATNEEPVMMMPDTYFDQVDIMAMTFNPAARVGMDASITGPVPNDFGDGRMVGVMSQALVHHAVTRLLRGSFIDLFNANGGRIHGYRVFVRYSTLGEVIVTISLNGGASIDYGASTSTINLLSTALSTSPDELATNAGIWSAMMYNAVTAMSQ